MNLESLEKLINSELTTKINSSSINHDELKLKIDERSVLMVILILGFFAQPFLAGPLIAGKNIIRLSSFGYFIMIYLLCYNLKSVNFNKKFYNFFKCYCLFKK